MSEPDREWEYPQKEPVAAGLLAFGLFILVSLVFNAVSALIAWVQRDEPRFLGHVVILCFSLTFAGIVVGFAVRMSRRWRRAVLVTVAIALVFPYLAAWALELRFITDWLYPHVPGTKPGLAFWPIVGFLVCAGYVWLLAYASAIEQPVLAPKTPVWPPPSGHYNRTRRRDDDDDLDIDEEASHDFEEARRRAADDPDVDDLW